MRARPDREARLVSLRGGGPAHRHELGLETGRADGRRPRRCALGDYYRSADVFVSASVHEGFCVPILEAMHHGVPVVALAAAAVPETVAGAGLLVDARTRPCLPLRCTASSATSTCGSNWRQVEREPRS